MFIKVISELGYHDSYSRQLCSNMKMLLRLNYLRWHHLNNACPKWYRTICTEYHSVRFVFKNELFMPGDTYCIVCRLRDKDLKVIRDSIQVARYRTLGHRRDKGNEDNSSR